MPLEEQENSGFGPIVKKRSKVTHKISSAILLALFLVMTLTVVTYSSKKGWRTKLAEILQTSCISIAAVFIGEHLRRACLFAEEYQHIHTRYKGSGWKVFVSSFAFPGNVRSGVYCLATVSIIVSVMALMTGSQKILVWFHVNAFLVPSLLHLIGFYSPTHSEISSLSELQKNNVAEGLVWAQYFGYLQHVLPNFVQQVMRSNDFRDKISPLKVLILIPKDCFISSKLESEDERIKKVGTLPELTLQLGGFPRIFKHTVYSIEIQEKGKIKPLYFVAEWPAILHRLHEMTEHAEAGLSREERDIQVMLFYRRLQDVLMNHAPRCTNTFCLVPYAGKTSDLVEVILTAIKNANDSLVLG